MSENNSSTSSSLVTTHEVGLLDLSWPLRLAVVLIQLNITLVPSIAGIAVTELLWPIWRRL